MSKIVYILWNHCLKSVQIRSFFWSVFSSFSPNPGNYGPEKTPYLYTIHRVDVLMLPFACCNNLIKISWSLRWLLNMVSRCFGLSKSRLTSKIFYHYHWINYDNTRNQVGLLTNFRPMLHLRINQVVGFY